MLKDAPKIEDVLVEFIDFIGGSTLIGHNVNFDMNFIYDNALFYLDKEIKNDFIDTLRLSRRIYPKFKKHKLSYLSEKLNLRNKPVHRSLADCSATFELYNHIKNHVETNDLYNLLKIKTYSLKARDITPNLDINYDGDCILQDKTCVFTGTLTRMIRKEAMQIVVNLGGLVGDGVTKKTNYLIIPLWAYKTILNL